MRSLIVRERILRYGGTTDHMRAYAKAYTACTATLKQGSFNMATIYKSIGVCAPWEHYRAFVPVKGGIASGKGYARVNHGLLTINKSYAHGMRWVDVSHGATQMTDHDLWCIKSFCTNYEED